MPRGSKSKYSEKQKRQAEHIEEGYEHRGVSHKEAARRAWATVNKASGGGNASYKSEAAIAKEKADAEKAQKDAEKNKSKQKKP